MSGKNIEGGRVGDPIREQEKPTIVYFDLMRHANRRAGKGEWIDPETGEVFLYDDTENLTEEGKKNAREYGKNTPEVDYVVSWASMEPRAAETGVLIEEGSGKDEDIGSHQVTRISYKELSPESTAVIKKVRPIIEAHAKAFPLYGRLDPEVRAKVREGFQVKGLAEGMRDSGLVQECAEGIAYNLQALKELSKYVEKGTKSLMPLVNHGIFNESFLIKVLRLEDEEGNVTGVEDVEDIGGFFKPGESFRIKVTRTENKEIFEYEFTNSNRQELFTGKKLSIDWAMVEQLARQHEERLNK